MRLSHWDFRPRRRKKYVTPGSGDGRSGPPRGRPTLRILLLGAFGVLVYLKYDDFIRSPLIQGLREPEKLWRETVARLRAPEPTAPSAASLPQVSPDSTRWEWRCASRNQDSCVSAFVGLDSAQRGSLRAALLKVRLGFAFPDPSSFAALFHRAYPPLASLGRSDEPALAPADGETSPLRLVGLDLESEERSLRATWLPDSLGHGRWCQGLPRSQAPASPCLEPALPRPPLRPAPAAALEPVRPPVLAFALPARAPVHPVLPGRVVSPGVAGAGWVKLHHGGGLFSYYSGLDSLRAGLRAGDRVAPEDTLGFAAAADSARPEGPDGRLRLRIERDGSPVDPMAFLGLAADSAGASHGP